MARTGIVALPRRRAWGEGKGEPIAAATALISRQPLLGGPFPMIHCDSCGLWRCQPTSCVELPRESGLSGQGRLTLRPTGELVNVPLSLAAASPPGARPTRWTPSSCSSWYYLRYSDPHTPALPFERHAADRLVSLGPVRGRALSHAILHLLYSRLFQPRCCADRPAQLR